ncbi:MAG: hypothetical protein ACREMH_02245 [Gemmatimonadales bacterium]
MPRVLSIARVRVATDSEAEYLGVIAELAQLAEVRGQHIWVFRHGGDPHTFIEFSESRGAADHRSVRSLTPREVALEARRSSLLVEKLPGGEDLWIEVALRRAAEPRPV